MGAKGLIIFISFLSTLPKPLATTPIHALSSVVANLHIPLTMLADSSASTI